MELLEDAVKLLGRYPRTCVSHGDGEVAVHGRRGDTHLAGVGELDGVADEVEKHLGKALFVAQANRQLLGNLGLECELLSLCQRLGRRPHRLDHSLDGVLAEAQAECPDSILAMSSTVLISPSRCLPFERMRVRASVDFLPSGS